MNTAKEFIENVIRAIVDNPEEVRVEASNSEKGIMLALHVAQADMGKVIGKSGANIDSIRALLRCISAKERCYINLELVEPEGSAFKSRERANDGYEQAVNGL